MYSAVFRLEITSSTPHIAAMQEEQLPAELRFVVRSDEDSEVSGSSRWDSLGF